MKIKLFILTMSMILPALFISSCGNEDESGEQVFDAFVEDSQIDYLPQEETEESGEKSTDYKGIPRDIQRWPMLPTGTNKCYDNHSEIECPEYGEQFFGQAGNYQNVLRGFVDNFNETLTDDVTNMVWQKGYKEGVTWYEAISYCQNLTLAGKKWRVPLTHELKSLIDYGLVDPAIDDMFQEKVCSVSKDSCVTDLDCSGSETCLSDKTLSTWFWAGKHAVLNDPSPGKFVASWIINFYDGSVEFTARNNLYNVRCILAE